MIASYSKTTLNSSSFQKSCQNFPIRKSLLIMKREKLSIAIRSEARSIIGRHFFSPADFHHRIRIFPIPASVAGVSGGCPICRCLRNLGCCLTWDAYGVSLTPGLFTRLSGLSIKPRFISASSSPQTCWGARLGGVGLFEIQWGGEIHDF